MDEFRRKPVNRIQQKPVQPVQAPLQTPVSPPQPNIQPEPTGLSVKTPKKRSRKKTVLFVVLTFLAVVIALVVGAWFWYQAQLAAVDSSDDNKQVVVVAAGTTPDAIAKQLEQSKLIRSTFAFDIYTRLHGVRGNLQAGTYRLSSSESTPEIVEHLTKGRVDTFNVKFLPGATLSDAKKVLVKAGFSESEIDSAFTASYNSPLFEGKPTSADLEGYIYGETYSFGTGTTVKQILEHVFKQYLSVIEKHQLVSKYSKQGLSLYEGITLASIIQRESNGKDDHAQISQIFQTRLKMGMQLGSDVTYQYIADKTGVARDVNLDSPYNTRRYNGLPPGPISNPGEKALTAVAEPSSTDYIYFLSGDDDVTYYGRTLEEHEANIRNHCADKCQII